MACKFFILTFLCCSWHCSWRGIF